MGYCTRVSLESILSSSKISVIIVNYLCNFLTKESYTKYIKSSFQYTFEGEQFQFFRKCFVKYIMTVC